MTDDHYVTLGVEPKADAALIRAAYHDLMRLYHPDRNDSPAAIERARAVIAAFAVLGDTEKRLQYDWSRRRAAEPPLPPLRWYDKGRRYPLAAAFAVLALGLFVAAAVIVRMAPDDRPPVAGPARLAEFDVGPRISARERTSLPPTPRQPSSDTTAPIEPVPLVPPLEQTRPEPIAVAPIPAATLRAALPRQRLDARAKVDPDPPRAGDEERCRAARPGAEATVCNNDQLAALDQNVVLFYNQSLSFGAAAKRPALLESRARFLARREQCRSDLCLQHLHLAHLRELTAIVANAPPAQPR